jgi:hypothetical protein
LPNRDRHFRVDNAQTGIEDSNVASWQDRAVETWFKPADGGYIFRCPNPWLLGPMRTYLASEAQKRGLAVCLRQRQRLILWLLGIYLLFALGLTMLFEQANPAPESATAGFVAIIVVALLGMLVLALVPHLYLMRKISPLVVELQRTDEPTTLHDQLFGVAAVISPMHLALGGLGGFLVAASNIKSIYGVLYGGEEGSLAWSGFGLLCGVALASYFAYLTMLRRKLKRRQQTK